MSIKAKISSGEYVCPKPVKWDLFYKWLKLNTGRNDIPTPLILSGWWPSTNFDKNERLIEQIQIASDHGIEDKAYDFLSKIPDGEWLISSD